MDRRTRTVIVVAIALLMATLASAGVYRAVQRIPVREVEVATSYAVVAAEAMPVGTLLRKEQLRLVAWPAASPVQGGFDAVEKAVGRGLIQQVAENQPITESILAAVGAGGGLPPTIPQGMRAMSVRVNDVIGVAGFAVPGTRVDVIVTLNPIGTTPGMSRVVLSNIEVLAVGTLTDQQKAKEGEAIPSTVVTLKVTPEDAERIALAESAGKLTLVLRNPLDGMPAETRGIRMAGLMGAPEPPPVIKSVQGQRVAVPRPTPPAPAKIYSVEAIRAAKRTEETVR